MPRGRPSGTRDSSKRKHTRDQEAEVRINEKIKHLTRIFTKCANEHLFVDPKIKTKTDCDYCPVAELCRRVWNNSGYNGMEQKLNVIMKLKHGEPVSKDEMNLTNPYEHNKEKPRKRLKML